MRVLITGGTGFIGSGLCRTLLSAGHEVSVISRSVSALPVQGPRYVPWDRAAWRDAMGQADAVVNLAGESIAAKRWTLEQKARIRESRVETTRRLVEAMATGPQRPSVLVSASAIGIYGDRGDAPVDESSTPGAGFLADTCQAWEAEARRAEPLGVRVVRLRIGLVLAPGGGALQKMAPPFRWFVGGPLGSGWQWVSWVHRDDVVRLIEWALARGDCAGALNATAPTPVTMSDFCRAVGQSLRRPSWLPAPALALKLLLGEMADMLLTGQRVMPRAALSAGFIFRYPALAQALDACKIGDRY